MITRRRLLGDGLRGLPLLAIAPTFPGFLARTAREVQPDADGRSLVVVQLDGGNDGLNTVVPYAEDVYAKARPQLRLAADRVLKIADGIGLNPSMEGAAKLLESGRLAIIQGVGYPNPSRSHFASMATWHTAKPDPEDHGGTGWIGRGLDLRPGESSLYIGDGNAPAALRGRRAGESSLAAMDDLFLSPDAPRFPVSQPPPGGDSLADFARRSTLDALTTADRLAEIARRDETGIRYPDTALGRHLQIVSRLLKGGAGARVFYVNQSGYDTHSNQLFEHASLLRSFSSSLLAFLDDLDASGLADRVLVLTFSEFGRRVQENGSAGTDHGTAGPVFLAGPNVKTGLIGEPPALTDLDAEGDPKPSIDFRRVYATVLENWLGLPSEDPLGGPFAPLPLLKTQAR
jgi:uncharacterized protein (DUF1501 family)